MQLLRICLLAILVSSTSSFAQNEAVPEPTQRTDAPFRLFRTLNIHTFLKLDTRTGQIWQLQWGTEPGYNFVEPINLKVLAVGKAPGRFTLFPTTNIFNFILLDQEDGRQWEVQWSIEDEKRLIVPIEPPTESPARQPR